MPIRTIENWRSGKASPTRRDSLINLLKVAAAFPLSESETDLLLQCASHPALAALRREARSGAQRELVTVLAAWTVGGPARDSRYALRAPLREFVGRTDEIAELTAALLPTRGGGAAIGCVSGMGGVGKSELAMVIGNTLREHFPDGQLMLDLRGSRKGESLDAAGAVARAIQAFDSDVQLPKSEDQLVTRYRTLLAGKRVFILADDAYDAAQIAFLKPPVGSALLITSRNQISLAGMVRVHLNVLDEDAEEGLQLLKQLVPRLKDKEGRAIAAACEHLPLALRIAVGVLTTSPTTPARYLALLENERDKLAALQMRDAPTDPEQSVEASLALSYNLLNEKAQAVLRMLGVFTASFDKAAAATVLQLADEEQLLDQLDLLYRRSLVRFVHEQDRYDLHELVRVFALARLENQEREVRLNHARYYVTLAERAQKLFRAGGEATSDGLALFDRERPNLDGARQWLQEKARKGEKDKEVDVLLVTDADMTAHIGGLRYRIHAERIPQIKVALEAAARLEHQGVRSVLLGNLGMAYEAVGDTPRAIDFFHQHLALARDSSDDRTRIAPLINLGLVLVKAD